jgi:hypothetical protein
MTAGAARLEREPSLRLIKSDSAPGFASSVRNGVRTFFGRIAGFFSSAWNWVKKTLHLDAVGEQVSAGYRWARMQGARVVTLLGTDGLIGAGLLTLSTSTGRSVVGFLLKPVSWALDLVAKGYTWLERTLANKSKGGVRNWLSDRMRSVREFLFGEPTLTVVGAKSTKAERKVGVVNTAILWFAKTFSGIFTPTSVPMRIARSLGTFLLGRRGVMLLPLLPLGALLTPAMFLAGGLTIWGAMTPWQTEVTDTWDKAWGKAQTAGSQAAAIVDSTEEDLKEDVDLAADAVAGRDGKVPAATKRAATKVNREARRGHPAGKVTVRRAT